MGFGNKKASVAGRDAFYGSGDRLLSVLLEFWLGYWLDCTFKNRSAVHPINKNLTHWKPHFYKVVGLQRHKVKSVSASLFKVLRFLGLSGDKAPTIRIRAFFKTYDSIPKTK
jgi:hypothetical protein